MRPLKALRNLVRLRLQHDLSSIVDLRARVGRWPTSRRGIRRGLRLSCAIGSCSRISPLKIQTLTPQVP
jgi:hypothetical protein